MLPTILIFDSIRTEMQRKPGVRLLDKMEWANGLIPAIMELAPAKTTQPDW
jgi:hypothetical protein